MKDKKLTQNITITTLTHLIPLSGLPATLQDQQFFSFILKKKKSALHDTKEIKMKIQEPSSECNTKHTAKTVFRELPHIFFSAVSLPDHGCLWAFQQHRSIQLRSDMGTNVLIQK